MEDSFAGLAWSFAIQTLSGVVSVFVGIWLALVFERRRRAEDAADREAITMRDFYRAVVTVIGRRRNPRTLIEWTRSAPATSTS